MPGRNGGNTYFFLVPYDFYLFFFFFAPSFRENVPSGQKHSNQDWKEKHVYFSGLEEHKKHLNIMP